MGDLFADMRLREKKLFDELAECPVVDLLGIVDASGVGGGKTGRETLWTLTFSLDAWKHGTGSIHKTPLTVRRKVSDKELKKFQRLIDSESIVFIRARIAERNSFGSPQALLEKFVRVESNDGELNAYLVELKKPVTFEVPVFGIFILNRRVKWFVANTIWCGHEIKLNLAAAETTDVEKALMVAKELWESANNWNTRVQDYAVQQLLELKNDNWVGDDDHEVTVDEFKERMTLEAITVNPDGSFDFWHNDGDMFYGHAIEISGNIETGLTRADTPG
jgi:hypothetical protein